MSKSSPTKAATKKKENAVKPEYNAVIDWNRSVEYHKLMAEWWNFAPWEGVTQIDLLDFVMYGDLVSQAYLYSLRKAAFQFENKGLSNHFEKLLLAHARRLNEMICELARSEKWMASQELWDQALKLSETFSELALKKPALFKTKAKQSLFMPSIRTKNPEFTADAKAIADAIELSADTVGSNLKDNRTRLGAFTAKLVGECVDEIIRSRRAWSDLFTPYKLPVIWPTQKQINPFLPFLGKSVNELLAGIKLPDIKSKNSEDEMTSHLRFFCLYQDCGIERIHFLMLPELTAKTAPDWWKGAIEKMIEAKFPLLLQQPNWEKEINAISGRTTKDKLRELKKRCESKVKQFAPRSSCQ